MIEYYLIYIVALIFMQINSILFMKKFQLSAGTSLSSNTLYMLINGIVSAVVPLIIVLFQGKTPELTSYSFIMAFMIVVLAAIDTFLRLKAYEKGQIATVNIVSTLGSIILSCFWGVFVLKESISVLDIIAIIVMILAILIISHTGGEKINKKLIWIYVIISFANSFVSILSKQHQVESNFATVDTLSFSIWIGAIRTVIFSFIAIFIIMKKGRKAMTFSKASVGFASISSVVTGIGYIITLFTGVILPIVITSPLSIGFSIIMSALLPLILYRERLTKRQWIGVTLSLIGTLLFLIF